MVLSTAMINNCNEIIEGTIERLATSYGTNEAEIIASVNVFKKCSQKHPDKGVEEPSLSSSDNSSKIKELQDRLSQMENNFKSRLKKMEEKFQSSAIDFDIPEDKEDLAQAMLQVIPGIALGFIDKLMSENKESFEMAKEVISRVSFDKHWEKLQSEGCPLTYEEAEVIFEEMRSKAIEVVDLIGKNGSGAFAPAWNRIKEGYTLYRKLVPPNPDPISKTGTTTKKSTKASDKK
jgi:signal recognition particle GTPase